MQKQMIPWGVVKKKLKTHSISTEEDLHSD